MRLDVTTPKVMSIINVTPDSFFAESRCIEPSIIERKIHKAIEEGCDILDIGGYSSRPGAAEVTVNEEIERVLMGATIARRIAPNTPLSVDTFRSEVVDAVVKEAGEVIVNDISAGEIDDKMIPTVVQYHLPYIAMHMRGTPRTMQNFIIYDNVAEEVINFLRNKSEQLAKAGVEQIILDPGFGFAKTLKQNYQLLEALPQLVALGYPVLAGLSRKSMIYKALNTTQEESLTGTIALNWECLRCGCKILRVHDTKQALQTIKLFETYESYRQSK